MRGLVILSPRPSPFSPPFSSHPPGIGSILLNGGDFGGSISLVLDVAPRGSFDPAADVYESLQ
jgi:hypothetical protein